MKNLVILFFLLFIACNSDKDVLLLAEYIGSYNKTIKVINKRNKLIYDDFDFQMTDVFYGRPLAVEPWDKKATSIKLKSNSLYLLIDSIESIFTKKVSIESLFNLNEIKNKTLNRKIKLSKSDIALLKLRFAQFREFTKLMIGKDSSRYEQLVMSINGHLNSNEWNQIPSLSGNKSKLIEILAVLTKLKMSVRFAEFDILVYLYSNVDVSCFRFYKIEPIIEPNAQIIPQGFSYTANIFLGIVDTTANQTVFIEDEEFQASSGKLVYKEKARLNDTLVHRNGYFLLTNPATRKPVKTTFKFEYEVIK